MNRKHNVRLTSCTVLSLLITIIGVPLGEKLSGRFAITNVFQIMGFVILLPDMLRRMTKKFLAWFFFLIFSMLLSMFSLSLFYDDLSLVKFFHIGFFTLMLSYIGYFIIRLERDIDIRKNIEYAYQCTIILAFVYLSYIGIGNAMTRVALSKFGFDDKSHAVFFCAFYAFITLKYVKGDYKLIMSVIFMVFSLMSASRLVVPFLPFYLFILFHYAFKIRNVKSAIYSLLLLTIILLIVINAKNFFYVYTRVTDTTENSAGLTRTHLDLIRATFQMKFENIFNIIFGTGPGNFGDLFRYTEIKSYMQAVYVATRGRIPAHSSHLQIFLEFSIVMFVIYIWFLYRILIGNWKNKNIIELCFYIPLYFTVPIMRFCIG